MLRDLCLLLLVACSALAAESDIDKKVSARLQGFPAKVTFYAKNLKTGQTISREGNEPVRTASTIKLPIMIECFWEAAETKLKLSEPLELIENEKVTGSGILQELTPGTKFPLRDLIDLMIVLSDNTATNLILNRIGGNAVNERMASLGLMQTRVMRKILRDAPSGVTTEGARPENKKWGLGRSSPQEMVVLLEKVYRGELIDKSSSDAMLAILKHQRDRDGIARDLKGITVAEKTGALDALRSDVAIVYSPAGDLAMAITVEGLAEPNWTADNPGLLMISDISTILIEGLTGKTHN
jgi:beta-lactamase class A